jgi:predicted Zn finger-like uncharacterized protein
MDELRVAKDLGSWFLVQCPYCDTKNWVSDNSSKYDVEAIKCFKCEKVSLSAEEINEFYENPLEESLYEVKGQPKP